MAATFTFTVDAVGDPEAVVAQSDCMEITVYENDQAGTADYLVRVPFKASPAVTKPAGTKYIFRKGGSGFSKGSVAGYVEMVTGSVTFAQEEA
jgi:hypothetical protein